MRILVTGGCGFIGSNFIRHIFGNELKVRVVNLDNLTYAGRPDNLKGIQNNPRYEFIKGDICDVRIVKTAIRNCDCLVNFAAQTHVDRSIMDASSFVNTNVLGTQVLLEVARDFKIAKFVHISTDEVYGSLLKGSSAEDSLLCPNSPYAASKAAADLVCRSYFITYNLPVVITRSSNNFGPYQYPEKFVSLAITNMIEGKDIPVYGDGKNVRDWIYVEDNVKAICLVLKKGIPGGIYNIAGRYEISNNQMAKDILKLMPKSTSKIKYVRDRLGHDRRYSLDDTRIRRLGFNPRHGFESAITKTLDWYKSNPSWWMKIKYNSLDYKKYYKKQYGG